MTSTPVANHDTTPPSRHRRLLEAEQRSLVRQHTHAVQAANKALRRARDLERSIAEIDFELSCTE